MAIAIQDAEIAFAWARWAIPVASWIVGFGAALALEHIRNRRRLKAVARVLFAEVERIRQELGKRQQSFVAASFYGVTFAIPAVHPWVHKAIAEGAEIDAKIVAGFLRLDRELTNARHLHTMAMDSATQGKALQEAKDTHKKQVLEAWIRDRHVADIIRQAPEGSVRDFESATAFLGSAYVDDHNRALETLAELESKLVAYLR